MRIQYNFSSKRTGKFRKPATTNKHRVAFPKMVREVIKTSDIVLEVLDARFIDKTRNPEMENFVKQEGKKLIYIINKVDLINLKELKMNYDLSALEPYVLFSCKSKIGRTRLRERIKIEVKRLKVQHAKARVGIIGYPNTGKSSLINVLSGGKRTATSPESGFTTATHKIRFNKDIIILDTPGVFGEKENAQAKSRDLKTHAQIGVRTYDKVKSPDFIVAELMKQYPGVFEEFYKIDANGDSEVLIEELGRQKKLLKKGGVIDSQRTARVILKDWQDGKIKV